MKLTSYALRAPLTGLALLLANTALAETMLPSPYISRALDAVLIPINGDVIDMFALYPEDTGVLVLAVQDGGIAAANGIEPGDVISFVSGHAVSQPIDLDTIVYYWISTGVFDFVFDGYRGDSAMTYDSVVSYDSYFEVIEVSSVESWSSYSYESFSYSEYYAEYSVEMTETYEYSETTIEETASSEEWVTSFEEETEALLSEEETTSEDMTEEAMTEDDSTDEAMSEEVPVEEDMAEEEPVADDAMEEEPMEEDATDESGDEGGGEEAADEGE